MSDADNEIVIFDDGHSILEEFSELPDLHSTINCKHDVSYMPNGLLFPTVYRDP